MVSDPDVRAIRTALGMSQQEFAAAFGFTLGTVRDWEQTRRRPEMAARTLLTVIAAQPDLVRNVVRASMVPIA